MNCSILDLLTGLDIRSGEKQSDLISILHEFKAKVYESFPKWKLLRGLVVIKNDRKFAENQSIKVREGNNGIAICDNWVPSVIQRFEYFAVAKATCHLVDKYLKGKKNSNIALEYYLFLLSLYRYLKAGQEEYASATLNPKNTHETKSVIIENPEYMLPSFDLELKSIDGMFEKMSGDQKDKEDLVEYFLNFDIIEFQKDIFNGIIDDFDITKISRTGKQSKRYKTELLWNLFKHTHSTSYIDNHESTSDSITIRMHNLLKIISRKE